MIIVRDIFQVRFGQAQPAIAAWRENVELERRLVNGNRETRLLTDLVGGSYYTLILESTYDSLGAYEEGMKAALSNKEWKAWYQKFIPLVESGRREILKVVD